MFLYYFIRLSYCKITLKIKKQKYNFSKHNHLGIFAQKKIYVEKHRTRGFAQKNKAGRTFVLPAVHYCVLRISYSLSTQTRFLSP